MKKTWLLIGTAVLTLVCLISLFSSRWFWSLPFIPTDIKNTFHLNASIFPASDDSRSLFLSVNPHFRAEFGDREAPTSAFVRFEVTSNNDSSASSNADIDANPLLSWRDVYQAFQTYQPGIEWQLFSVGVDETQFSQSQLAQDSEILRLAQENFADSLIAQIPTDLPAVLSRKQNISTQTQVSRLLGYDVIENMAVAPDVDLHYRLDEARGLVNQIVIGDRQDFDTACLQLLQLGLATTACDLPANKFSFLLKLDPGQTLVHSPLALDQGTSGSYYLLRDGQPFLRFANPILSDAGGQTSPAVTFELTPASVAGQVADDYYIVTLTADLGWLLDRQRQFPVTLETGFYLDQLHFFTGEVWE